MMTKNLILKYYSEQNRKNLRQTRLWDYMDHLLRVMVMVVVVVAVIHVLGKGHLIFSTGWLQFYQFKSFYLSFSNESTIGMHHYALFWFFFTLKTVLEATLTCYHYKFDELKD